MKNFYIVSLGCPKNLVDSEIISAELEKNGYKLSLNVEGSDLVVINTCGFINSAINESKKVIREMIDFKKKGIIKKILVCGCLVERFKDKIFKKNPYIDGFIGIEGKGLISFLKKEKVPFYKTYCDYFPLTDRLLLTKPHSSYLKIAEGCDNFCSYCVIPFIRGKFRSKKIEDIIDEAKKLVKIGVKEISLIAQDTTRYGMDLYGRSLLKELLINLEKIKGLRWIRLMYLYPNGVDRDLLKIIKNSDKIINYIEMPVQHSSDSVLKAMNRKYNSKMLMEKMDLIKKIIPDAAIRTSIIVGFPSETEKDFKNLLSFIHRYKPNYISVFKYSREEGTVAYYLKQLPSKIINERYLEILNLNTRIVDEFNKSIIGKEYEVIFDSLNYARSYMDAPDIDGKFEIVNYKAKVGEFKRVKVIEAAGYLRKAEVV
ncbi:MAG: 30S ribosomal protein S12 methylthiotransferase RimO [Elusimicrobiota bacterium]